MIIEDCYFSLNKLIQKYTVFFDNLAVISRKYKDKPTLFMGNFNGRAHQWNVTLNTRGKQ